MDSVTLVHILWIFVLISFLPFLINNLYPSPNLSNLWTLPDRSRQYRSSCTNQWKLRMSNHWPITVSERDKVDSWTGVIWVVINTFRINKIYLLGICLNINKIHINIYIQRYQTQYISSLLYGRDKTSTIRGLFASKLEVGWVWLLVMTGVDWWEGWYSFIYALWQCYPATSQSDRSWVNILCYSDIGKYLTQHSPTFHHTTDITSDITNSLINLYSKFNMT